MLLSIYGMFERSFPRFEQASNTLPGVQVQCKHLVFEVPGATGPFAGAPDLDAPF